MAKNLISIVIVNWNGKKWLGKCLDSLERQTYKKIEVVFVDNASSDDSVEFVKQKFPKIKIIKSEKNLGLTNGIKLAIEHSSGEFLLLINNDAWVEKDFIKNLYDFYAENNFAVIAPQEKRYDKSQDFKCNTTIDLTGSPAYFVPTYSRPDKTFYLSVCFFVSKKEYGDSGGLDTDFFMYNEDVDWFWRLSLLGKKFSYVDNIYIYHAGAGSTGAGLKYNTFLWRNQNALQMIIKNYSLLTLIIILPLYLIQNIFEMFFFVLLLKPKISFSYIQGLVFNIRYIRRTLEKRKWVQSHRKVNDIEILKKMYFGFGKTLLFMDYLQQDFKLKKI